jgi:bifunctional DNase/RNase
MENNDKPIWIEIKKLKRKINHLDYMDRDNPEFKKLLKDIEEELQSMKYEMVINNNNH